MSSAFVGGIHCGPRLVDKGEFDFGRREHLDVSRPSHTVYRRLMVNVTKSGLLKLQFCNPFLISTKDFWFASYDQYVEIRAIMCISSRPRSAKCSRAQLLAVFDKPHNGVDQSLALAPIHKKDLARPSRVGVREECGGRL
jgi:hypothetical protein